MTSHARSDPRGCGRFRVVRYRPRSRAECCAERKGQSASKRARRATRARRPKGGEYNDAASAFTSAIALDPSAQLKLGVRGAPGVQLGKLALAKQSLKNSIDDANNLKRDKKSGDAAKKALDDVESRIPSITVAIAGPDVADAHTTIDAKAVDAAPTFRSIPART